MKERNYQQCASIDQSRRKSFSSKTETKKQVQHSAVSAFVIGLVLALGAIGFAYWDYREQVKFYNIWERGAGLDFKTGKPIPNYQPPPFQFCYDRMAFLPHIIIFGSVSMFLLLIAASEFRKSSKMIETEKMRSADAEREALANSPEMKRYRRDVLILQLAPFVVLVPVPFIAVYKLGIYVFLVYIILVAVFVGALHVYLPREK
jgi:hypothetical protein